MYVSYRVGVLKFPNVVYEDLCELHVLCFKAPRGGKPSIDGEFHVGYIMCAYIYMI